MKGTRRNVAEYYIYAGIILLVIDVGLFLLFNTVNIAVISSGMAAAVLIFVGIERMKISSNRTEEDNDSREYYMMNGMIPGYIQRKYIKTKTWYLYSVFFIVSLVVCLIGLVGLSIHSAGHQMDIDFVISMFGLTLVLYIEVLSMLIANEYCNKLGLPHNGGPFEIKVKRTKLCILILDLCSFSIFAAFVIALYCLV